MKNIIITAGGTSEPIDGVRMITNSGTGRLGSLIADELADRENTGRIFYVCARGALLPKSKKAELVTVGNVDELKNAVERLLLENKIDAVVHSMAVSDYRARAVSSVQRLSESLNATSAEDILSAMDLTDMRKSGEKLSSRISSPLILLEPTPKVLRLIRPLAKNSLIVGFKLLSGVTRERLFEVAKKLMNDNGCDYVLANDSSEISGDCHHAFLISRQEYVKELFTKQEIARAIADAVTKENEN